jgi:FkbM family methyltransferase
MDLVEIGIMLGKERLTIEAPRGGVIARAWGAGRWYEFPLLEYIRSLRLRGLAVDAGANVGNHTLWLSRACGLRVAAFEPLHHAILERNVARNRAAGLVTIYRVALGAGTAAATHLGKGALRVGFGEIPVRTLDSFALGGEHGPVALIKADVEFMEPQVLAGGAATIRRDRPIILSEVHPGHEAALAAVLRPLGYRRTQRFRSKFVATPIEEWRAA